MSGAGKSHFTRALRERGFQTTSIDTVIAARLNREDGLELNSLAAVSEWMGFPSSPHYPQRSARYQQYEADALAGALDHSAGDTPTHIIDTTGSVIYLEQPLLDRMRRECRIVHLQTPPHVRDRMLTAFRAHPTPLIWGDAYDQRPGETPAEALNRSFDVLVDRRESAYNALGHVTLSYEERHDVSFDIVAFLQSQNPGVRP